MNPYSQIAYRLGRDTRLAMSADMDPEVCEMLFKTAEKVADLFKQRGGNRQLIVTAYQNGLNDR